MSSEQALGDGEGQGSPACCGPWGHKELDMTQQLNNNSVPTAKEPREVRDKFSFPMGGPGKKETVILAGGKDDSGEHLSSVPLSCFHFRMRK